MRPETIGGAASTRARSKRLGRITKTTTSATIKNPTLFQVAFLVLFVLFAVAARYAGARRDPGFHAARVEIAKRPRKKPSTVWPRVFER